MPWEINIVTSVTLLAFLHPHGANGVSQENTHVIECIRDLVPLHVYRECCDRENNCTVARQQNRAIDCMSRIIMSNYSSLFSDFRESPMGLMTTENYAYTRNHPYYSEFLESLAENCKRQPRTRLQTCIRNETVKRCRFSMLQERFSSSPIRDPYRRSEYDLGYEFSRFEPRRRGYYGSRRGEDGLIITRPLEYGHRFYRGGRYSDDSVNDEEFGYTEI